jgi:signal transduction histidine kinase
MDTVERCGRALFDTIQHVLDFTKINHFTRVRRGKGAQSSEGSRSEVASLNVDVDLSAIIEDVIDAMYAGYRSQGSTSFKSTNKASRFPLDSLRRGGDGRANTADRVQSESVTKKDRLAIILDIDWRSNWIFNTRSGDLRRVLMNLFSNALKYTDVGGSRSRCDQRTLGQQTPNFSSPSSLSQSVILREEYLQNFCGVIYAFLTRGFPKCWYWAWSEYCAADCSLARR